MVRTMVRRPVYDAVAKRHRRDVVIIPPRVTAIANGAATSQRDRRAQADGAAHRWSANWQRVDPGYRRSLVETAVYRYKTIIGRRLCAQDLLNQRTEAKIRMQCAQSE